jgi:hypothetical protein
MELKQALRSSALEYESKIIYSGDKNRLHKYLKMARSHSSEVTTLVNSSGELITSAIEIANELNNSFSSVSTVDNGILHPLCKSNIVTGGLNLVYFDAMDIFTACNQMKETFSVGPDGISPVVYKHLASCLAEPLAMIFCIIMQQGNVPDIWKTAIVTPIYKKGPASNPQNYRPISLTCVGCKLFESKIKTSIVAHLQANNLMSKAQQVNMAF